MMITVKSFYFNKIIHYNTITHVQHSMLISLIKIKNPLKSLIFLFPCMFCSMQYELWCLVKEIKEWVPKQCPNTYLHAQHTKFTNITVRFCWNIRFPWQPRHGLQVTVQCLGQRKYHLSPGGIRENIVHFLLISIFFYVQWWERNNLVWNRQEVDDIVNVSGQGQLSGLKQVVSDWFLENLVSLAVQYCDWICALHQGVLSPQDKTLRQNVHTKFLKKIRHPKIGKF